MKCRYTSSALTLQNAVFHLACATQMPRVQNAPRIVVTVLRGVPVAVAVARVTMKKAV
jgi:hypothetical protein